MSYRRGQRGGRAAHPLPLQTANGGTAACADGTAAFLPHSKRIREPARLPVLFWLISLILIVLAGVNPSAAADLYVTLAGSDENNGSRSAPFRTILAASQHAQPGTTVHVAPGTYTGDITTTASGTAAAGITYVSDVPWGAKIATASRLSIEAGWWNKGDYVVIKQFEIDGSRAPLWRVGFYGSSSHSIFEGNKVHDILTEPAAFAEASASGKGGAGVEMDNYSGAVDGSLIGNMVYNVGLPGHISSLVHGIYQIESGRVTNNVIYNVAGVGITLWHGAKNIDVVNNTIDGARDGGILVGSGDSGSNPSTGDYITVANNIVANSNGGISEGGITGLHNRYIDNLLYGGIGAPIRLQNGLADIRTIVADPRFANAGGHDYHLLIGSPAVGAGTPSGAPTADFDGTPRLRGTVSIGAYEGVVPR